ncbi:MAG: hypothetical protein DRG63_05635 [Deltaproteobacteria bacterium]|nr:MAG: hypothetical protein DRG63_05635 [Deltaproteobacteria bacterium]
MGIALFINKPCLKGDRKMAKDIEKGKRSRLGYGSSYRLGRESDLDQNADISTVLGRQVWVIKPDKKASVENPCVWMQAGVVEFKSCNNYYDCTTCKYDLGMKKRVGQGKQISWQDAMRRRSGLKRICRHSLTGRIEMRQCAYDYECFHCDFDQFFEEVWASKAELIPKEAEDIRGFRVPLGYYFHSGHTWVKVEEKNSVRIGIDDFTIRVLGPLDKITMPLIGKEIEQGRRDISICKGEYKAPVLSPVSGVVTSMNLELMEQGSHAVGDPYADGWVMTVHCPDLKQNLKALMISGETMAYMENEINRLVSIIEETVGPIAADGGIIAPDLCDNMPELKWKRLAEIFLTRSE